MRTPPKGDYASLPLTPAAIAAAVVDSASIEVNRRARRAKTDRLDAQKLVRVRFRLKSLWQPHQTVRARIEGETWAWTHGALRTPA